MEGDLVSLFGKEVPADIDVAPGWAGWPDDHLRNGDRLPQIAGEQRLIKLWVL